MDVGWDEVRARRLARSSLSERASGDRLVEVVGRLCGVQAQVQASAELQLAARVDVVQADVRAGLWERRALVKAWTVRGTLHLHPADELPRLRSGFGFFLGELCQGPPQGSRITLVRPDQWIEGWGEVADADEALREVCGDSCAPMAPPGPPTSASGSPRPRSRWRMRGRCSRASLPTWRRSTSRVAGPL